MSVSSNRFLAIARLGAASLPALAMAIPDQASAQTVLPDIVVNAPSPIAHHARHHRARPAHTAGRRATSVATHRHRQEQQTPPPTEAEVLAAKNTTFDDARARIAAPGGAVPYTLNHQVIESMPQGTNATVDKVLLQAPGVTQDSAASGDLHIRNEHANLQYRINGIALPDGVGGFGQIIDTALIGNMSLITGALPAQYGLRTAGVVDIQTKTDAFNNGGSASVYGGSHGTVTPSIQYGGTVGQTQYFISGRYFGSDLGLENPTAARSAIHDHTDQEKGFLYLSTVLDPTSRLTFISGVSNNSYQIPNNPGQTPAFTAYGVSNFDSSQLNERQTEFNQFNVLAYQKSVNGFDLQLSYFNRISTLHFMPDTIGDLVFNGVASDVYRRSISNGIQADTAYRLTDAHTLRAGFGVTGERSLVNNGSVVLPLDGDGNPFDAPFGIDDSSARTGWLFSAYVSDEWKIANTLTLTSGLRFDDMEQYISANQLSPRISLTWKPFEGTTFHAGYARNFTPPPQVLAAPTNLALVQNTTQQPAVSANDPVLPERSHVFDVGVVQKIYAVPGLEVGLDAYYKKATDLLDDGQFGAAYVLTAFNYARGENAGVEFKTTYTNGNFRAYGNVAWGKQIATNVVSNQYLFSPDDLAYIAGHYIYTDHSQIWTASAGASYLWRGTRFSADFIYGSGLRADDEVNGIPNGSTVPAYTQVNLGLSHDFNIVSATKPTTLRFDVVNLFDTVYQIRNGSGIGVFAPQYGQRRGFYAGITQKF
ncbi:MAG: hypothetical protein NTAFB05_02730 [Nitrobacter sp.]|uniref:TonB-dependent receptor n=1 Tax=Nitrobacter sp. TaxID=29420 RepID=UPI00387DEAC6